MRIALDARTLYSPARRGIGKSLAELYRHVAALRPDWDIIAFHRPNRAEPRNLCATPNVGADLPGAGAGLRGRAIDIPGDRIDAWERFRLPLAAWRCGADVLHCPANTCPSWMPVPTVVNIYDLIPLDLPEGRPPEAVRRFERCVRTACRRAARVVSSSQYTRKRLVDDFGADPGRIAVAPLAADTSMRPVSPQEWKRVLQRYDLRQPMVLHFGAGEARKNTRRLIEAWAMTDRTVRRGWQLAVVGLDARAPQTAEEFAAVARQLGVASSVRLRGYVDGADLPALMSAAEVLAYPSLSEGFGLPILDAWSTNLPVLTSDVTSLPEVAGDAALLVDPTDPCAIARGLTRLMQDSRLRQDLVARGRQRLAQFSWESVAKSFIQIAEQIVESKTRKKAA